MAGLGLRSPKCVNLSDLWDRPPAWRQVGLHLWVSVFSQRCFGSLIFNGILVGTALRDEQCGWKIKGVAAKKVNLRIVHSKPSAVGSVPDYIGCLCTNKQQNKPGSWLQGISLKSRCFCILAKRKVEQSLGLNLTISAWMGDKSCIYSRWTAKLSLSALCWCSWRRLWLASSVRSGKTLLYCRRLDGEDNVTRCRSLLLLMRWCQWVRDKWRSRKIKRFQERSKHGI